jgi:hypothetical protein
MKDQIEIYGESFRVSLTAGPGVYIVHPTWSMVGHGRDIEEAKRDLLSVAEAIAPTYCSLRSELAPDEQEFVNWLRKVLS